MVRRDTLLILNLGFHVIDGVGGLDLEGDGLAGQGLNKDLHASTKTEDYRCRQRSAQRAGEKQGARTEVKGRLLLNVVVRQRAPILELLTSEDETLLVRGDTLLVLDLRLDVVDGVARLNVEGNGLTRQGLDETAI